MVEAAVADLGKPLSSLRVDGGLTRSRLLMQAQADLLQVPVLICRSVDATALGVAALAAAATSLIHAFLTITLRASQIVSGLALTIFAGASGLSSYIGHVANLGEFYVNKVIGGGQ